MPFLLAEILNFQGSTHRIGVGSFRQLIFTLAHKSDMTIAPSTAVKRSDSHITGNLKYLIFEDRIYIENKLNKGSPFV